MINGDIDLVELDISIPSSRGDRIPRWLWMPCILAVNEVGRRLIISNSPRDSLTVEVDAFGQEITSRAKSSYVNFLNRLSTLTAGGTEDNCHKLIDTCGTEMSQLKTFGDPLYSKVYVDFLQPRHQTQSSRISKTRIICTATLS